jgi:hypothetical protein
VFYMIAPVIYVKRRGKVTRGKALLFSLVNWLTIQFLFLITYVWPVGFLFNRFVKAMCRLL